MAEDASLTSAHEELYRTLGRALIQVQGVELLLKQLLASRYIGGTVPEIEKQLATRHLDYATNTFGTLVGELFKDYVVPEGFEHPEAPDPADTTLPAMHVRFSVALRADEHTRVKKSFEELVATRNDFVHHLVTGFALTTPDGARDAVVHLQAFTEKLRVARGLVRDWAESQDALRLEQTKFMQSDAGYAMVVDGIMPSGEVIWPISGLVRALKEAAKAVALPGVWVPLKEAIAWIQGHEPTQTPSRYGCMSYRHAIHESKAFDVKNSPSADGTKTFFYRPRV
jgi:hypothetical protein